VDPDYPIEKIKHSAVGLPLAGRKRGDDDALMYEMAIGASEQISVDLQDNVLLCECNSTTTPLAANAEFTGIGQDVTQYQEVTISIVSDVISAVDGIEIQFSRDNSDWHTTDNYSIISSDVDDLKTWKVQKVEKYFRLHYINGANPQTHFEVTVFLAKIPGVQWSHRIKDDISGEDDAGLIKAILAAERAGGTPEIYTNIQATTGGNLKVSIEEAEPTASVPITFQDTLYMSEFSELRTASPGNRSDVEFIYDKQPLLVDDISAGAGSAVHQSNGRDVLLSVGGTDPADQAGLRLHYWVPYTPGSGQEIDITGTFDNANIGGGTMYAFLRTTVSGSTTLQTIEQSNWDALSNGVNWQYSHICRISFQSLKVGRIQFAIVQGGLPYKVTEITNDDIRATGYWQYASLPPYWKIYNDSGNTVVEMGYGDESNGVGFRYVFSGTQSTATARAICETVKSQGGERLIDIPGYEFEIDNYLTLVAVSTTLIPVLSIRVASTFNSIANRSLIIPQSFSLLTNNTIVYRIFYRPTLTGPSWTAVDTGYSGVEYDVSASAITGGVRIDGDYVTSGIVNRPIVIGGLLSRVLMSLGSTGTSDILSIAAIRLTANADVYASLKWKEIR